MELIMKTCTKCNAEKTFTEFPKEKRNVDGLRNICKDCHNKKRRNNKEQSKYADTVVGRANRMYHTAIKGALSRDIDFDIEKSWFVEKLLNGKCEVTGIPFILKSKEDAMSVVSKGQYRNPFSPSIDRIDNSKGYSTDNCQMVCVIYNTCKGCFSEEAVEMFCRGYLSNGT